MKPPLAIYLVFGLSILLSACGAKCPPDRITYGSDPSDFPPVGAGIELEPALLEADWPLLGAEVAKIGRQRALLVLLTPLEPAAVEESLLPPLSVLAQRYKVIIGSVADPALDDMLTERDDAAQIYDAAAAARTLTLRDRTASAVGRLGVDVVDAPPDKLPATLADHYLLLKSRGLL